MRAAPGDYGRSLVPYTGPAGGRLCHIRLVNLFQVGDLLIFPFIMPADQFRENGREGVQIESFGAAGKFGVKTSKTVDNGRWGIALVARNAAATGMWKNIFLEDNSSWGNHFGNVSPVIRAN